MVGRGHCNNESRSAVAVTGPVAVGVSFGGTVVVGVIRLIGVTGVVAVLCQCGGVVATKQLEQQLALQSGLPVDTTAATTVPSPTVSPLMTSAIPQTLTLAMTRILR